MSTPNPGTTPWVPMWNLNGGMDLRYNGAWQAGNYYDGDVVVYNGITYLCVRPTNKAPTSWLPGQQIPSYGTTLPATPYDGQEAILVDSISNPSYTWRFRYNASSTSAYKWEFVGGAPAYAQAGQGAWSTVGVANAWVVLSPSLSFNVPRGGDYWGETSAQCSGGAVNEFIQIALGHNVTIPITTAQAAGQAGNVMFMATHAGRVNSIGSGGYIAACYYGTVAGMQFANRWLAVTPIRVA